MINLHTDIFKEVDESELWLLCAICKRLGKNRTCWPSIETLLKDTGWGVKKLRLVKNSLIEKGIIQQEIQDGTSNKYYLTSDLVGVFITGSKLADTPPPKMGPPPPPKKDTPTPPQKGTPKYYPVEVLSKEEIEGVVMPFKSKEFETMWEMWKQYKSDHFKFKYKSTISEQMALVKLVTLSKTNEKKAIEIISEAIANGWKGLFEIKDKPNNSQVANGPKGSFV